MQIKEKSSVSISPVSGKSYPLPENENDIKNINEFINNNSNKQVIVVQGLGFVGSVMSLVCANALYSEYAVIGIDIPEENSYWKICSINEGQFPVIAADPKIEAFYLKAREKKNLYATYDPYAYSKADVIVVDVNLDVAKQSNEWKDLQSYDVDLSNFKKAIETIGRYCREDVLILVETTVPPGTCQKVIKPIIESCLMERGLPLDRFCLGHSYERVMPGPGYVDSIQNFYRVYSGIDERSADRTEEFLRTIIRTDEYPLTRLGNTNSTEMSKVLENSFRAMNIAFIVEWSRLAEEAGVNIFEVVHAIRMRPTHKNIMLPGLGVGGYCLTKDPLLASWARRKLLNGEAGLDQSEAGVRINDKMPQYAFEFLKRQYGKSMTGRKVLLLGVSYLNDVGDTRNTPVELFHHCLQVEGCEILLHDPHVRFWEEKQLAIEANISKLLDKQPEIIVVSTGHSDYRNNSALIDKIMRLPPALIFDTIGVFTNVEISKMQEKHAVKVLGRGDL